MTTKKCSGVFVNKACGIWHILGRRNWAVGTQDREK